MTRTMVKDVKERTVIVQDANKETKEIPYGLLVWATGNTSRNITRDLMSKLPETQTQRRGLLVDDFLSLLGAEGVYAMGDCTATQYAPTAQAASQQGAYLAQMFGKLGQKAKLEQQLKQLRADPSADSAMIEGVVKKLNRVSKLTPFHYSHQVSFASSSLNSADVLFRALWRKLTNLEGWIMFAESCRYIGSEKAIADLPFFNGNVASGGGAAMLFWRSAYIVGPLTSRQSLF